MRTGSKPCRSWRQLALPFGAPGPVSRPRGPGIDLADPHQRGIINRQFWGSFAQRLRARGLDPEDCLQEVYRGVLTRNRGARPYDPRASSLSTYSYIVIRSVFLNYLDHNKRADRRLGVVGQFEDAALAARSRLWEPDQAADLALGRTLPPSMELPQWL